MNNHEETLIKVTGPWDNFDKKLVELGKLCYNIVLAYLFSCNVMPYECNNSINKITYLYSDTRSLIRDDYSSYYSTRYYVISKIKEIIVDLKYRRYYFQKELKEEISLLGASYSLLKSTKFLNELYDKHNVNVITPNEKVYNLILLLKYSLLLIIDKDKTLEQKLKDILIKIPDYKEVINYVLNNYQSIKLKLNKDYVIKTLGDNLNLKELKNLYQELEMLCVSCNKISNKIKKLFKNNVDISVLLKVLENIIVEINKKFINPIINQVLNIAVYNKAYLKKDKSIIKKIKKLSKNLHICQHLKSLKKLKMSYVE